VEVPKHILRALEIHFVTHLEQVLALALRPPLPAKESSDSVTEVQEE